jgi:two-component system, LytTR family, response regulator
LLKAILIDDEKHCLDTLSRDLSDHCPDIQVIERFEDPQNALRWLRENQPDLVFLDVQMPGLDGFQLLEALHPVSFSVVFTTAYSQFAIQALRVSAVDYLVKPVDKEELKEAVGRVLKIRDVAFEHARVEALLGNLKKSNPMARVALPTGEGFELTLINNIVYCEAEGNFSYIFLQDGRRLFVSRSLKDMEALLEGFSFCRVHHSYLINLGHVVRYLRGDGGEVEVSLGRRLPVSKGRKRQFLDSIS